MCGTSDLVQYMVKTSGSSFPIVCDRKLTHDRRVHELNGDSM